jgi:hypothetical protein
MKAGSLRWQMAIASADRVSVRLQIALPPGRHRSYLPHLNRMARLQIKDESGASYPEFPLRKS